MKGRILALAATVSLLVAVAMAAFWVRGLSVRDRVEVDAFGRRYEVATFPHHLYFNSDPGWSGMPSGVQFGTVPAQYPSVPKYLQPRLISRGPQAWSVAIPFWLPLLFAIALPGWWGAMVLRSRRRKTSGLCPVCGYDLRATVDRCPECGHDVPAFGTPVKPTSDSVD